MRRLLEKLHVYSGLLGFTALVVFGIAGLSATFEHGTDTPDEVRKVPFETRPDESDRDALERARVELGLALTRTIPGWGGERDDQGRAHAWFETPNGRMHLTLLEAEGQAEIALFPNSAGEFFTDLHMRNLKESSPDLVMKAWALYVELSTLILLFMAASGVLLWLMSRPRVWWAHAAFWSGAAAFGYLYTLTRYVGV